MLIYAVKNDCTNKYENIAISENRDTIIREFKRLFNYNKLVKDELDSCEVYLLAKFDPYFGIKAEGDPILMGTLGEVINMEYSFKTEVDITDDVIDSLRHSGVDVAKDSYSEGDPVKEVVNE